MVTVMHVLRCQVYCRWSWRSSGCCPGRERWTPEARTDCDRSAETTTSLKPHSLSAQLINISSLTSVCKRTPRGSPVRRSRRPSPPGNHSCRIPSEWRPWWERSHNRTETTHGEGNRNRWGHRKPTAIYRGIVMTVSDLQRCSSVQSASQKFPGLNGHRSQLPLPLQDVSNGVDVRNAGLLLIVHWDLPVPGRRIRKGLNASSEI